MKKMLVVLLGCMILANVALAEDQASHERDLKAVGHLVDARLVAAIVSEDAEKACPDFNLPHPELIREYLKSIMDDKGRLENSWRLNINTQAMMLSQEILGIVNPEANGQEAVGKIEVYYRSGVVRQISIFPSGKVICGMTLEKNLPK